MPHNCKHLVDNSPTDCESNLVDGFEINGPIWSQPPADENPLKALLYRIPMALSVNEADRLPNFTFQLIVTTQRAMTRLGECPHSVAGGSDFNR